MLKTIKYSTLLILMLISPCALASNGMLNLHATTTVYGYIALFIFSLAYVLVIIEEKTHFRKSKPVVIAAGIIWVIIALMCKFKGLSHAATESLEATFLEYAELFLFLLVAMTYVNTLEERNVFKALRAWLINKGFNYRQCFWVTGVLAFFISPIADNLTTALIMCAVVMAVGVDSPKFVLLGCINIVIAANAGGAFSPFGDITTLMVWQKGRLAFFDFFVLFVPAMVNFLVPAAIMHFSVPKEKPHGSNSLIKLKFGAKIAALLFLLTIATTVVFANYLHLPATVGMMTGLGYLMVLAFFIARREGRIFHAEIAENKFRVFNVFNKISKAEWDTLLFFYGVMLSVGGLAVIGYLEFISITIYEDWGALMPVGHKATIGNISIGILSAIIDNIPVMFAILTMNPIMSDRRAHV